jgi:tetratricopeptide (TPR) repeat protein
MGIRYSNSQAFTAAHSYMREAVEVDSTYAEGFANLGTLLMMNDAFDYALSVTEEAIALEPEDDRFHLLAGRIWKRRGYYDKAIPWLEKALELNPRNVAAAIQLVDCQFSMESEHADLAAGIEFLERFLEYEPDNGGLEFRIGRLRDALARRLVREEGTEAASTTTMEELFETDEEADEEIWPDEGESQEPLPAPEEPSEPEESAG